MESQIGKFPRCQERSLKEDPDHLTPEKSKTRRRLAEPERGLQTFDFEKSVEIVFVFMIGIIIFIKRKYIPKGLFLFPSTF